jgi:predicted outer membrane repeat protein
MRLKPAKTAATTAAVGGVLVLSLGYAPAAMASPENYHVPCNADALNSAIDNADSGSTLYLTAGCTYYLPDGLTDNVDNLTIVGYDTTLRGGGPDSDYSILTVNCMKTLTIDDVNFTEGSQEDGGAIDNQGHLTVNGGIFSRNSGEYGGAIYSESANSMLTVNNAVFTDNDGEYGGAIYSDDNCTAVLTGDHFSQNRAQDGGAIYAEDNVTVADSTFLGNTAEDGGAIINYEDLSLTNVTDVPGSGNAFTGNKATLGGAIYNGDWVGVGDSLIDFNTAHYGGGIYNKCSATLTPSGSTIVGNLLDNIYNEGSC